MFVFTDDPISEAIMSNAAAIVSKLHARYPAIVHCISYQSFAKSFAQHDRHERKFKWMSKQEFDAVYEQHLRKLANVSNDRI